MNLDHILVHLVHLELDVAVLRDEDLRGPNVLRVRVILNAGLAANQFGAFALRVLLDVAAASYAFVLVAFVLRLLDDVHLFAERVMDLSGLQRFGSHDLNLPEVLTALRDQILSLDEAGILRDDRDGLTMRVVLVVRPFVLVEERQVREYLTAHITFEAYVGNGVLKGREIKGFRRDRHAKLSLRS